MKTSNTNTCNVTDSSIAVALSGGGHRASLFGLGVLIYLYEIEKNQSVTSISSVSGGSITNGYLGQECNFTKVTPDKFQKITSCLWNRLTFSGIVYATFITKIYVLLLFSVIGGFIGIHFLMPILTEMTGMGILGNSIIRFVLTVGLILFLIWLLSIRGKICRMAFAKILFSSQDKKEVLLDSLSHDNIDHVICATELHAGEHIYFSGNFVYSYRCGLGLSKSATLAEAVQASAAFPPLLPPVWINSLPCNFAGGQSDIPSKLILTDGGVYDNMGEQWIVGLPERKKRSPEIKKLAMDADVVILVNSTAGIEYTPVSWFNQIPLLGECTMFYRIICALFDQTTTARRKNLFTDFKNALVTGKGMQGIMVMLEETPFSMLDWMNNTTESELEKSRSRAVAVLDKLPEGYRKDWDTIKEISLRTSTTFRIINQSTAENLIYHAFIVAMINAHVILGYPMFHELLDKDEFRKKILNKYCN
jgi:predicted acylesterase/phospholipase RssA